MANLKLIFNKTTQIDVLDIKQLKKEGYNPDVYYCGNFPMQDTFTKLRTKLSIFGIKFPFNRCCFIHDMQYKYIEESTASKWTKIRYKTKSDYIFLRNMIYTLKNKTKGKNALSGVQLNLLYVRAVVFYIIVSLLTPYYLIKGIFFKK